MTVASEDLTAIEPLRDLPEEELRWFADTCQERAFEAGEVLFAAGEPAREMFFLLEGAVAFNRRQGSQEVSNWVVEAGEIGGRLPFSRMHEYTVELVAQTAGRLAVLPTDRFGDLHRQAPQAEERFVHRMLDRTRDVTRSDVHREKLASLGTMAAGLAHELNNPASAARRTARELEETLQAFDEHSSRIVQQFIFKDPPPGDEDPFEPVYERMTLESPAAGVLEQSDLEDELADWLDGQGVAQSWTHAPTLVAGGFTKDFLEEFAQRIRPDQVRNFLEWVPRDVSMRLLVRELIEGTERIAELITAMKSYSYMDQDVSKDELDLHEGMDTTLRVLKHKLRKKDIRVEKRYGDLPRVSAFGGELNQVWTNLIDNAVAAVERGGIITLATTWDARANVACVDVIDDGSGIPKEIQDRIFEPFFTTRPVGEGSGLGLDITHRIVTRHHQGSIQVESKPGRTRFRVRIPVG
ncbi:MAG: ATP-binding protein [Acidobacteriota bacterium]